MNIQNNYLLDKISNQKIVNISGITNESCAYLLEKVTSLIDQDIVFVANDNIAAQHLADNLRALIDKNIHCFLEWDTQAYDLVSPSKIILEERVATLSRLSSQKIRSNIVITTINAILQKIISKQELQEFIFKIKVSDTIKRDIFIQSLVNSGYRRESSANEGGEFAVRGSIIDILVSGQNQGYRIDFFGNQVDTIKTFDISSQLTEKNLEEIIIIPASELIISNDSISKFEQYLISNHGMKALDSQMLTSLKAGIKPNGIETWHSIFYSEVSNILDYLNHPTVITDNFSLKHVEEIWSKNEDIYQNRLDEAALNKQIDLPLPPKKLFFTPEEVNNLVSANQLISCDISSTKSDFHFDIKLLPDFKIQAQLKKLSIFLEIKHFINLQLQEDRSVIISCFSEGSRDRVGKILTEHKIAITKTTNWPKHNKKTQTYLVISSFSKGFICPEYTLITEQDIFGEKLVSTKLQQKTVTLNTLINEAQNFTQGELVVHKEYGIGKFEGLETIELSETKHDCIKIIYADNDKLFLPVENIELISKYGSANQDAKLDKLGSAAWQTRKAKIKKRIKESAEYLLSIAAKRALHKATVIEPAPGLYDEFCATFPYVETEDQIRAINEVKNDLAQEKPMDRLICGDIGFGKTEVALRAAFMTIKSHNHTHLKSKKQVALICPTTILARQHFSVFNARFKQFDIKIAHLSRLVATGERNKIIKDINENKVDVIIGTHALLNNKINFDNLALLIIDEEQHFGVLQKEKLKKIKKNVHILSMSATPLPRTLQMSLTGIKDLSLIATPPVNRLVTKTNIVNFDPRLIREALSKEHLRGGQSFFICPRISDLFEVEIKLKKIIPDLKIAVAHGKLQPAKIDQIMNDFYEGKFDILLSTSIIESGIDVPKANTMIVYKAEKFGLSQLYQIRGRIGRSNLSSYAYFVIPNNKKLSPTALKRLEILQAIDQLGSGFSIASHDMDIRGYGNLVGEEQSGHIKEVGVELYQKMLAEAVKSLQYKDSNKEIDINEEEAEEEWTPQINLGTSILIPESYISDFDIRLSLYQRASKLKTETALLSFAAEIVDRFGPLPNEVENLLDAIKLKQLCIKSNIKRVDGGDKGITLELQNIKSDFSNKLLNLITTHSDPIKIRHDNKILLQKQTTNGEERVAYVKNFIYKMI